MLTHGDDDNAAMENFYRLTYFKFKYEDYKIPSRERGGESIAAPIGAAVLFVLIYAHYLADIGSMVRIAAEKFFR